VYQFPTTQNVAGSDSDSRMRTPHSVVPRSNAFHNEVTMETGSTDVSARWTRRMYSLGVVAMAVTVCALGLQNRNLREDQRLIVQRFLQPHPGMLVPEFVARSLEGDTVTIGSRGDDSRQVLFFFSASCVHCAQSLPAITRLSDSLQAAPALRARVIPIALDSSALVRRFVHSTGFRVPVFEMPSPRFGLLYRVRAVPQVIVLDSSGHTVYARAGSLLGAGVMDSILSAVQLRRAPAARSVIATVAGTGPAGGSTPNGTPVNRR
jgi:peroxiredoxin